MKFVQEFKAFVMRGNVMDLAVGVIIGAAFGKIVTALTTNVLMPILSPIIGATGDVEKLVWKFNVPWGNHQEVSVAYGEFINAIIQFIILAFCVFLLVKVVSAIVKKKETPAGPSDEVKLLTEIRDLLKNKSA